MNVMNGTTFGTVSAVINILLGLFLFGHFYNRWIEKLGARGEGWSWLQVVGGVFMTLIGIGLLDLILPWNAFFTSLLAFAASGAPMAYGARKRHLEALARAEEAMKE